MNLARTLDRNGITRRNHKSTGSTVHKKKNSRTSNILWSLLLIVSILVMLYPIISTLYNNNVNSKVLEQVEVSMDKVGPDNVNHLWEDMLSYNEEIKALPPSAAGAIGYYSEDKNYQRYLEAGQLPAPGEPGAELLSSPNGAMSQLVIPEVNITLPVYKGTTDESLYRGAGHLYGTTLPTGGIGSNTAISAHTGLLDASMFDNLPQLEVGDDIYLETMGHKMRYQMVGSKVVSPESLDALPTPGGNSDRLFLITCTPYGINSDRLIVEAVRVQLENPAPDLSNISNSQSSWAWWMWLSLGAAIFIVYISLAPLLTRLWRKYRDR